MESLIPVAFHPVFIHFAIGLAVFGVGLDAYAHFTGRTEWHSAAKLILAWGCAAVVLAALSGWWDHERWHESMSHSHSGSNRMVIHEYLGWSLAVLFAGLLWWRLRLKSELPRLFVLISLLAVLAILAQGHIGGQLVFLEGTGVRSQPVHESSHETVVEEAPVRKQAPAPEEPAKAAEEHDHSTHEH